MIEPSLPAEPSCTVPQTSNVRPFGPARHAGGGKRQLSVRGIGVRMDLEPVSAACVPMGDASALRIAATDWDDLFGAVIWRLASIAAVKAAGDPAAMRDVVLDCVDALAQLRRDRSD